MSPLRSGLCLLAASGWGCVEVGWKGADDEVAECPATPSRITEIPQASCVEPVAALPVSAPWEVTTLWSYGEAGAESSSVTPVVGYLEDTNGDGVYGAPDVPDVVVAVGATGELDGRVAVLSGADGSERWRWGPAATASSAVSLADLDGDGRPEILAVDAERFVVALSADGAELWRTTTALLWAPSVILAGRDGSGAVVVVAGNLILDGATGAVRATLDESAATWFHIATLADLDLDGEPELLSGMAVYSLGGELVWEDREYSVFSPVTPLVVQLDGDPEAEVLFAEYDLRAHEHDGAQIPLPTPVFADQSFGIACFGDLEADGVPEVVWPCSDELLAVDIEGTVRWEAPITDLSGLAGCSLADLDADGRLEVLFADEVSFRILDGSSGGVLYEDTNRASGTAVEVPVPADVNGDGHSDILVVSDAVAPPVRVYTHAGSGWTPGGVGWVAYDYSVTNSFPDGALPARVAPWWQTYNLVRGRPAAGGLPLADLAVVAESPCGGSGFSVRVTNKGMAPVPAGVEVVLEEDGEVLARASLPGLLSGEGVSGVTLSAGRAWTTAEVLVDPSSMIPECDTTNNRVGVEAY